MQKFEVDYTKKYAQLILNFFWVVYKLRIAEDDYAGGRSLKMLEWVKFIALRLFVLFRLPSSLRLQRKTKRHVLLLLFVLTPAHLNWPNYATGKLYRSPRLLISTMKHLWLYTRKHWCDHQWAPGEIIHVVS